MEESRTEPSTPQTLPSSLLHLSRSFIALGLFAVAELIADLSRESDFVFDSCLPLLVFGIGIRQLSWGWRTVTLVYCWLNFLGLGYAVTQLFDPSAEFGLMFAGERVELSRAFASLFLGVVFLYLLWVYRVLTRGEVRELFVARLNEKRTVRSW